MLGLESLGSTRRSRSMGVGPAVRAFNDQAVPGLGGVWFGKQIVLALLGIHLAAFAREQGVAVSNITGATGVEALAVWWTYEKRLGWHERHGRLPGFRKLRRWRGRKAPTVAEATSRDFYIVQPMRIGTLAPLAAFGLVHAPSRLFNSYSVAPRGEALLEQACPTARTSLERWIIGGDAPYQYSNTIDDIDPTRLLAPCAIELLREGFLSGIDGEGQRRAEALSWVSALRSRSEGHPDWGIKPPEIAEVHWKDMRSGAAFGSLLAAVGAVDAGSLLDHVEAAIGQNAQHQVALRDLPRWLPVSSVKEVRRRAADFLDLRHDPSPDQIASRLCHECQISDDAELLARLIERDGRILRLVDGKVLPGGAFAGRQIGDAAAAPALEEDDDALEEAPMDGLPPLPEEISHRIGNLFHLASDLGANAEVEIVA